FPPTTPDMIRQSVSLVLVVRGEFNTYFPHIASHFIFTFSRAEINHFRLIIFNWFECIKIYTPLREPYYERLAPTFSVTFTVNSSPLYARKSVITKLFLPPQGRLYPAPAPVMIKCFSSLSIKICI